MDNLNTHFRRCFEEVLGIEKAEALLRRVVFHYTPKHASWHDRDTLITERGFLVTAV